jgi:Carbohydrate binding module (family 6)
MSRSIPARLRSVRQIAVVAAAAVIVPLAFVVARVGPAAAAPTRYEAETAVCQGTVDSDHTGFTGAGFCNTDNATGASVEWTVNATTAGTATLGFRYANGTTTNRPMDISVNGVVVASGVAFNSTGTWDTWADATLTLPLQAGANTVRATATTAAGGPNLDYLALG